MNYSLLSRQRIALAALIVLTVTSQSASTAEKKYILKKNKSIQVFEPHKENTPPLIIEKTPKLAPKASLLHKVIVKKTNKELLKKLQETKARKIDYDSSILFILSDQELDSLPIKYKSNLQMQNEYNMLFLNSGKFDTSLPLPKIKKTLKSKPPVDIRKQLYILQFVGPVLSKWTDLLNKKLGITIIAPVPKNAYLIWADKKQLQRLKSSQEIKPLVQIIIPYHPSLRISTSLKKVADDKVIVNLRFYQNTETDKILKDVLKIATRVIHKPYPQGKYTLLRIEVNTSSINELARLPGLINIERYYPKSVGGERQGRILSNQIVQDGTALACDPAGPTACVSGGPGYLNWFNTIFPNAAAGTDFQSFLIHFADSGIDRGDTTAGNLHPDFSREGLGVASRLVSAGRLAVSSATDTPADNLDSYGHGTVVASVIAGYANDNTAGATTEQDAAGYDLGLGIVPYAQLASTRIFDCCAAGSLIDLNPNIPMLYENAYIANARISSNSWGDVGFGTAIYTAESQQIDLAVRDARPGTTQNQEMSIVFLAGNDGYNSGTGFYELESLVNTGSVAKNAIVVGASENTNSIFSGCNTPGQVGLDVSDTWANDTRDTAFFTSRGPTSAASGSRNKPDLVAPGTRIQGAIPQANYPAAGVTYCLAGGLYPTAPAQTEYHRRRGSSFSAPAVAGAVAMLKQIFINRKSQDSNGEYINVATNVATASPSPSPALSKAWLMNTTTYLTRPGYDLNGAVPWPGEIVGGEDLPSPVQGMGLLNIERALNSTPRLFRDQDPVARRFTEPLQNFSYTGEISNPENDFRVTLAWTDADSASGALVNDIDLIVTIHRGATDIVYLGNNYSGDISDTCPGSCVTDSNNNVENIWIPASTLMAGDRFTVSISSATVTGDGFPNELDYDVTLNGGVNDPSDQDFALVVLNAEIDTEDDTQANGNVILVNAFPNDQAIPTPGGYPNNITANVLSNDILVSSGEILSIYNINAPSILGQIDLSANQLRYIANDVSHRALPAGAIATSDTSFTYDVTDGHGGTGTATANIRVTGINDAPTMSTPTPFVLPAIDEDQANPTGTTVSTILASQGISDVDTSAIQGIAITAANIVNATHGNWQFSTNAGSSWSTFPAVSVASSLRLRDIDQVRFLPDSEQGSDASFDFRAWDQSDNPGNNQQGTVANTSANGISTPFSISTSSATISVSDVNDTPAGAPVISGTPTEDQILSANTSSITDLDGPASLVFGMQWLRNGTDIAINGTSTTYTLVDADVGAAISVRATYTDDGGTLENVTSAATTLIANINDAPIGVPVVTGTPTEDQVLTADTSGISDPDGPVVISFSFQWRRDGVDIPTATNNTYTLDDADVGTAISVRASYADDGGMTENITSAATASVSNVNDAPVGVPVITGTPTEDQTLTADTGGINDADGPAVIGFTFQWLRDGVDILASTNSTYTLDDADVGTTISVRVSYTDDGGMAESIISATTTAVSNINDAPVGVPTISGTAAIMETLTANTAGVSDADGPASLSFSFQWLRDGGAIPGATNSTYLLVLADVGTTISIRATYTDDGGTAENVTSAPTATVTNINTTPIGLPTILGTPTEDQILTADTTGISDPDGPAVLGFSFQWLRDGADISTATNSTYTLGDADVGTAISVRVTYTDGGATEENLISAATTLVANINDAPVGVPVIIGTPTEDQLLTIDTSDISDPDGPAVLSFSFQWLRGGVNIPAATNSSYILVDNDVNTNISVRVSYTDDGGMAENITSTATALVTNVNDAPTGLPVIMGTPTEDQTLTADASGISDPDGPASPGFSFQWLRNGVDIALNGTANTYTLVDDDVNTNISVRVSYTDDGGTPESLTSAATALIANINDAPIGVPVITGTATEDQTLGIDTSGISDADGPAVLTFGQQWIRNGIDIALNGTASTYTLVDADVGTMITVRVTYTDDGGTAEDITSAATTAVVNVNDMPMGLPVITGMPTEDQILTVNTSGISDADGPASPTFSIQWLRDGVNIPSATNNTYMLGNDDVATAISVRASYIDDGGTAENVTSLETPLIANVNDLPVLDLNGVGASINEGFVLTQGDTATQIVVPNLTLTDPDSNIASVTINITNSPVPDQPNEIIDVNLGLFAFGGQLGTVYNNVTGTLTITTNSGTLDAAQYQDVLRAVTYQNMSAPFSTDARMIDFTVQEAGGVTNSPIPQLMLTVTRDPVDISLVLDTSGSMNTMPSGAPDTKIRMLQDAVELFVNTWDGYDLAGDRIGAVYFNTEITHFPADTPFDLSLFDSNVANIIASVNGQIADNCTGMGSGLQTAFDGMSASTNQKSVILFSDGYQNLNPMVLPISGGTPPHDIRNTPSSFPFGCVGDTNPIVPEQPNVEIGSYNTTVHTIGIGAVTGDPNQVLLEEIANQTTGANTHFTDDPSTFNDSFVNTLVASLSQTSLELVKHEKDVFTDGETTKIFTFVLNDAATKASFMTAWNGIKKKNTLSFSLIDPNGNAIPAGTQGLRIIDGDTFKIMHLDFPLQSHAGIISAGGTWKMLVSENINNRFVPQPLAATRVPDTAIALATARPKPSINFDVWALEDDPFIKDKLIIDRSSFGVGQSVRLAVKVTDLALPAPDLTVIAKVNKPSLGLGTFLSISKLKTAPVPPSKPTDQFNNLVDVKLAALLKDPDLRAKLVPRKETISLRDDGKNGDLKAADGIYTALYDNTTVQGSYTFDIAISGKLPVHGELLRARNLTRTVQIKSVKEGKTVIDVGRLRLDTANLQVTVTPIDKYGNYLGPGLSSALIFKAKNVELVGKLVDNLDGSYTQNFVSQNLFGDTIKLKVLDTELVVETGIDPRVYWFIICILLLLVIFALYKLLKK